MQQIAELQSKTRTPEILHVGETSRRSAYLEQNSISGRKIEAAGDARSSAEPRVRPRVVLLNDVGFQYGAGIALKRQAASFLLKGFEVHLVAWTPGSETDPPAITGIVSPEGWRGVHNVSRDFESKGKSGDQIVASAFAVVCALDPDVIVLLAPRLWAYLKTPTPAWPEIVDAADWLRGELGVSKSLWGEACVAMGREHAAIAIAIVSAKPAEHFRSTPGGYFHGMVAKAKNGELNLARTIWGLRQGTNTRIKHAGDEKRSRAWS